MRTIQETVNELERIINYYKPLLESIGESHYVLKLVPKKWSKKELLGHLIDSAQNNIRRFVKAQYEECPQIVYAQDEWVKIANYQAYDTPDLISLWMLLNKHICMILKNVPADVEKKQCMTGELHSIEFLADDYIKHLLHHLHQILNLEPVPYS